MKQAGNKGRNTRKHEHKKGTRNRMGTAENKKKNARKLRLDFLYKINTSQNTLVSYSKLNL